MVRNESVEGRLRALKAILLPAALGAAILYFSYHALAGEQGLARWTELQGDERQLQQELAELEDLRDQKNESLARLRDETLDTDYLEEVARTKLSYVRSDK